MSNELARVIQRMAPPGTEAVFTLLTGEEIAGVITRVGSCYVLLEDSHSLIGIAMGMIGAWRTPRQACVHAPAQPSGPEGIGPADSSDDVGELDSTGEMDDTRGTDCADSSDHADCTGWAEVPNCADTAYQSNANEDPCNAVPSFAVQRPGQPGIGAHRACVYVRPIDFVFYREDACLASDPSFSAMWNQIKNRLSYAMKANELDPKFGRIGRIVSSLSQLAASYPNSPTVMRHLAWCQLAAGKVGEALASYQAASLLTGDPAALFDLAVAAHAADRVDIARAALADFQSKAPREEWPDALALLIAGVSQPASEQPATSAPPVPQTSDVPPGGVLQGVVSSYDRTSGSGLISCDGGRVFRFPKKSIIDEDLLLHLSRPRLPEPGLYVYVVPGEDPSGAVAARVMLARDATGMVSLCREHMRKGDFGAALSRLKMARQAYPGNELIEDLYERCRAKAKHSGVPDGPGVYAKAKQAQLVNLDLDEAVALLYRAIDEHDNASSAVKDLASIHAQQGRFDDAIEVLEKYRSLVDKQESVDNLLVNFYEGAGRHKETLPLLKRQLKAAASADKKAKIILHMGDVYRRIEDYASAEKQYKRLDKVQPGNRQAVRGRILCLTHLGRHEEARELVKSALRGTVAPNDAPLVEAIRAAGAGGPESSTQSVPETEERE